MQLPRAVSPCLLPARPAMGVDKPSLCSSHFAHSSISIIFAIIFPSLDVQYPDLVYYHISFVLYNPFFNLDI